MHTLNRLHVRGYTAVQLLIVMAAVAIFASIALPGFRATFERQQVAASLHQLTAHLAMARNAAVTRRQPVSACPSKDGVSCRQDQDWSDGWILFEDRERTGTPTGPAAILRAEQRTSASKPIIKTSIGRAVIRFLPDGRSRGTNATISLCAGARRLADVVVNNAGRTRTLRYRDPPPCPHPNG
ncbi:GspH/FimT family pseudopilin [Xanthomonas maliensis]|uniref:GspH/FimT family pseudopilin n=1 Tax=Xanthomonas maliensis TaxID=1321368 RepID=UPI0003A58A86|nr:Tfp pilus assembly protein FimT/FimU [Xanthomonas maliensis]KAB7764068.1 prepilin-type cleavage/methylation domain-containing protein [Xanthomonas maliensis]